MRSGTGGLPRRLLARSLSFRRDPRPRWGRAYKTLFAQVEVAHQEAITVRAEAPIPWYSTSRRMRGARLSIIPRQASALWHRSGCLPVAARTSNLYKPSTQVGRDSRWPGSRCAGSRKRRLEPGGFLQSGRRCRLAFAPPRCRSAAASARRLSDFWQWSVVELVWTSVPSMYRRAVPPAWFDNAKG